MHFKVKFEHFKLKCAHFTEINFWTLTLSSSKIFLSKDLSRKVVFRFGQNFLVFPCWKLRENCGFMEICGFSVNRDFSPWGPHLDLSLLCVFQRIYVWIHRFPCFYLNYGLHEKRSNIKHNFQEATKWMSGIITVFHRKLKLNWQHGAPSVAILHVFSWPAKGKARETFTTTSFLLHFTRQVMIVKISDILSHILKHGFVLQKNSKV